MGELKLPKSAWGPGPWQDEPDFVAFTHAGLQCFIIRNDWVSGALNGYVALPPEHPWWGKHHDECAATPQCEPDPPIDFEQWAKDGMPVPEPGSQWRARMMEPRWSCDHQPVMILDAHGGITYGGPAFWPDAERGLDWGFGFDCAHAGDLSPMLNATTREVYRMQGALAEWEAMHLHDDDDGWREIYRELPYVRAEVEQLAEQLALVGQVGSGRRAEAQRPGESEQLGDDGVGERGHDE